MFCYLRADAGKEECWWTGCQASTWAVTGCNQYNRTQKNVKVCDGGSEYYCCPPDLNVEPAAEDCWWTGCQPNNWAVKGCDSYNRTERKRTACEEDGFKYECCSALDTAEHDGDCWWSGCQPKDRSGRGCPSNTVRIGSHTCPGGDLFQCCSRSTPVNGNGG